MTIASMRLLLTLSILIVLFLTINAVANDTFVYNNGSSVYPINTDKISMVSEKITVIIEGKTFNRTAHVTCDFLFENTTSVEVKAKVGFPAEDQWYQDVGGGKRPPLYNFNSFIEGKRANVSIKVQEVPDTLTGIFWYTWDTTFPPHSKVSLKNIYDTSLSLSYEKQWFHYILKTGSNWKGPIGHSTIEVLYKSAEDLKKRFSHATPNNYKVKGRKIIWEFKEFVPTEDIFVYENNIN